jgi:hypothetical protein
VLAVVEAVSAAVVDLPVELAVQRRALALERVALVAQPLRVVVRRNA